MYGKLSKTSLIHFLVLLAFIARGLIPVGFMPGQNSHSLYPMVVCSQMGMSTIFVPADKIPGSTHAPQQHEQKASDAPCAFATAFTHILPLVSQPVFWRPVLTAYALPVSDSAALSNNRVPYQAQGPPLGLRI